MEDDILKLEEQLIKIKKRKEKIQAKKALIYFKESENIIGEKFSSALALSILSNSWNSASNKQKEEWMKSAELFRKISRKQKSKEDANLKISNPQAPTENI